MRADIDDNAEEQASDRAASLRAMFPNRGRTVPPQPAPPVTAPSAPGKHSGRPMRVALVCGGVVTAAVLGVAFFLPKGGQAEPAAAPPAGTFGAVPVASLPSVVVITSAPPGSGSPALPGTRAATAQPSARKPSAAPQTSATTAKATAPAVAGARFSACTEAGDALFTGTFARVFDFHHVFVDTDGDTATGYRVPLPSGRFGADLMIENEVLYRSTGTDWSWSEVRGEGPLVSRSGRTFRWRTPLTGSARAVFNGAGGSADEYSSVLNIGAC